MMLHNYLKTALRGLQRNRFYSALNVAGLGIGMACAMLILLFVRDEWRYDRFHAGADNTYRVVTGFENAQTGTIIEASKFAIGPYRLADMLSAEFPEIAAITRIAPQRRVLVRQGERAFYEQRLFAVDQDFFRVLDFPLAQGNAEAAFAQPYSVVITEAMARKYFAYASPMGQVLTFDNGSAGAIDLQVTGVVADEGVNSHFSFDFLARVPMEVLLPELQRTNWKALSVYTYLKLPQGMSGAALETRLPAFVARQVPEGTGFFLQRLTDIHLRSAINAELQPNGDITVVYAFLAIAAFVLLIACINFTNLATALADRRGKEVGLRKTLGAYRLQLMQQFLGESLLLALLGLMVALVLVEMTLPYFNALTGKQLMLDVVGDRGMLFTLVVITLLVGLVAGSYPAVFLSAFKPVQALSGVIGGRHGASRLRKGLIIFQFAVAVALIVCTAVVYRQLDYANSIDLGYDKEQVLVLTNTPAALRTRHEQFAAQLATSAGVVGSAAISQVPPEQQLNNVTTRPEGVAEGEGPGMYTIWTDFGFVETLGLQLVAGRSFSRQFPADVNESFIINEAAVRMLGWTPQDAVGKTFASQYLENGEWTWKQGRIIGVLKDFHFESVRQEILPTVYFIAPGMAANHVVRIRPEDISQTLADIERAWTGFAPEFPLEYYFLDERVDALYRAENVQGSLLGAFAALAIMVACMGLFGLAAHNARRRRKEVGVRKVMGSSVWRIVLLLTNDFSRLVLLSNLIAWPVAYIAMNRWLESFAYRIDLTPLIFIGSGAIALCIAWVTVAGIAAKAASAKPVLALRYE